MSFFLNFNDYDFELPEYLIAQHPPQERGNSRLMVLSTSKKSIIHSKVMNLADYIPPTAIMVFNNSKVRKARLFGEKSGTNQHVEFLLLQPLEISQDRSTWVARVSKAKKQWIGAQYLFPNNVIGTIFADGKEGLKTVEFSGLVDESYLDLFGHMPLPPYIKRQDTKGDEDRYQTVYSKEIGSVAAPTAGLHFTKELLSELDTKGIQRVEVTLHVGLGTFLPVRVQNILEHNMHAEEFVVSSQTAHSITHAKNLGHPVVAVGTTSVRTLESAWDKELNKLEPGNKSTDIFIYPGYTFRCVDILFTNFHTPKSTLMMLVSAFSDRDFIFETYREAVREEYKFFSYGDAMLITP